MRNMFYPNRLVALSFLLLFFWCSRSGLEAQCPTNIVFFTQADVDAFPITYMACTDIPGNVSITSISITDLSPLSSLNSIGGNFTVIAFAGTLSNFSGLGGLNSIGGNFSLTNSTVITSLTGLNGLDSIGGNLNISNNSNPSFTNLAGLSSLKAIGGSLLIDGNTNLAGTNGLPMLNSIGGSVQVTNNPSFTNLDGLSGVTSLGGSFIVENNSTLSRVGSTSLGFSDIPGNLSVQGNGNVFSLAGLGNVSEIGGSATISGTALLMLSDLNSLTMVGGVFTLEDNGDLLNVIGLDQLSQVGGLQLIDNIALQNISSLGNLTKVLGNVSITGNGFLPSLTGLGALSSIGGNLVIRDNGMLADMSALDDLITVLGGLTVDNNDDLTSLSGLQSINPQSLSSVTITNNDQLTNCAIESVCSFVDMNPGSVNVSGNAAGCTDFMELEAACVSLPVTWTYFRAIQREAEVALQWQTDSEVNNLGFEVQKSFDGSNWENIGFVEGKGDSDALNNYQFMDIYPSLGVNYYRLKQMDVDGAFEYSSIVSIMLEDMPVAELEVFPNPTDGPLQIRGVQAQNVLVLDQLGREVQLDAPLDQNLDLSSLPDGLYLLRIYTGTEVVTRRIFKK